MRSGIQRDPALICCAAEKQDWLDAVQFFPGVEEKSLARAIDCYATALS